MAQPQTQMPDCDLKMFQSIETPEKRKKCVTNENKIKNVQS